MEEVFSAFRRTSQSTSSAPPPSASRGAASSPTGGSAAATASSTGRLPSWDSSITERAIVTPDSSPPPPFNLPRLTFTAGLRWDPMKYELVVWDPMKGEEHRVPWPDFRTTGFSIAVLGAADGCDHSGCQGQGGPFRVVVVLCTGWESRVGSACFYSSETDEWSELTSVDNLGACGLNMPSILVDDALYFSSNGNQIVKCQLATLELSEFEKPVMCNGELVKTEDGGLGFASLNGLTLTLWLREISSDGTVGWAKHRVIDLVKLLPDGPLSTPTSSSMLYIMRAYGFMDVTHVILVGTDDGVYMVELKSGRSRKVLKQPCEFREVFPYASFCIPGPMSWCLKSMSISLAGAIPSGSRGMW